jgi:hypothetical protein
MTGTGRKPQGDDDFVEVAPAKEPIRVRFDEPEPTPAQAARPLRLAMVWILLLVLVGLFWSAVVPEAPPAPAPRRAPSSGTTTL